LAISQKNRGEVNQGFDLVRTLFRNLGDHPASHAVSDKDDGLRLSFHDPTQLVAVSLEGDLGYRRVVSSMPWQIECRCLMSCPFEQGDDFAPAPGAMPCAVDKNIAAHGVPLCRPLAILPLETQGYRICRPQASLY